MTRYVIFETSFGYCALGGGRRVSSLILPLSDPRGAEDEVRRALPGARRVKDAFGPIRRAVRGYFDGDRAAFGFELDLSLGTAFQRAVWDAARRIAYGQVRTYGDLAAAVGRPGGGRAVGQALGRNPVPLLVPCHRVVRSDGSLGGFSAASGVRMKRAMLRLEGVRLE